MKGKLKDWNKHYQIKLMSESIMINNQPEKSNNITHENQTRGISRKPEATKSE